MRSSLLSYKHIGGDENKMSMQVISEAIDRNQGSGVAAANVPSKIQGSVDPGLVIHRGRPEEMLVEQLSALHLELTKFVESSFEEQGVMGFRGTPQSAYSTLDLEIACRKASNTCDIIFSQHSQTSDRWIHIRNASNQLQGQIDMFLSQVLSQSHGRSLNSGDHESLVEAAIVLRQNITQPILQLEAFLAKSQGQAKAKA